MKVAQLPKAATIVIDPLIPLNQKKPVNVWHDKKLQI
jgi:hypothetical protein